MLLLARPDLTAVWAIMVAAVQQNLITELISRVLELLLYSKLPPLSSSLQYCILQFVTYALFVVLVLQWLTGRHESRK